MEEIGIDDFAVSKTRPQSAIRRGDHKLLYFYEDGHIELYDLSEDPGEQNDLSDEQPDLARELAGRLQSRLKGAGARFPTPN